MRPDGRPIFGIRKTTLSQGSITTAHGSSFVRMGNTSVVCGIKGEVALTTLNSASDPRIIVNLELLPLCSPLFKPGKPSEQAQIYAEILNRLCGRLIPSQQLTFTLQKPNPSPPTKDTSQKVDNLSSVNRLHDSMSEATHNSKTSPKIDEVKDVPEQLTVGWYLYADLYCLDYDGNVFDCALIALLTALHNVHLPTLSVDSNGEDILASEDRPIKLQLHHHPVAVTFGVMEDHILADPTAEEESLLNGSFTIIYNEEGLVSYLSHGGSPITDEKLKVCMKHTKDRLKEILKLIQATIK